MNIEVLVKGEFSTEIHNGMLFYIMIVLSDLYPADRLCDIFRSLNTCFLLFLSAMVGFDTFVCDRSVSMVQNVYTGIPFT